MKNKKKIVIAVAAFFAVMTLFKLFGALLFPIAVLLVIACIKLKKSSSGGEFSSLFGGMFDSRGDASGNAGASGSGDKNYQTSFLDFLSCVCRLSGYVSRAGGTVTREQISIVSKLIDDAHVTDDLKTRLQNEFNAGKNNNFDFKETCGILNTAFHADPELKDFTIDILLSLICSDHIVNDAEINRLIEISGQFGMPMSEIQTKMHRYTFTFKTGSSYSYSGQSQKSNSDSRSGAGSSGKYSHSSDNRSSSRNNSGYSYSSGRGSGGDTPKSVSCRSDALSILGLSGKVTPQQIKRAYLKLIKEYHPDRLKARGITGSLQSEYEEKCKLITEAYNYLK